MCILFLIIMFVVTECIIMNKIITLLANPVVYKIINITDSNKGLNLSQTFLKFS